MKNVTTLVPMGLFFALLLLGSGCPYVSKTIERGVADERLDGVWVDASAYNSGDNLFETENYIINFQGYLMDFGSCDGIIDSCYNEPGFWKRQASGIFPPHLNSEIREGDRLAMVWPDPGEPNGPFSGWNGWYLNYTFGEYNTSGIILPKVHIDSGPGYRLLEELDRNKEWLSAKYYKENSHSTSEGWTFTTLFEFKYNLSTTDVDNDTLTIRMTQSGWPKYFSNPEAMFDLERRNPDGTITFRRLTRDHLETLSN